jgi:hypothetical protein
MRHSGKFPTSSTPCIPTATAQEADLTDPATPPQEPARIASTDFRYPFSRALSYRGLWLILVGIGKAITLDLAPQ